MIDYNLMGNIIGWPMFISGVLAMIFIILNFWVLLTSVKVKIYNAKVNVDLVMPALILLWICIGASLIWGIK